MKSVTGNLSQAGEIALYTCFALILALAVTLCHHFAPVWHVRLIAEDCWGENMTAVCFALSALLLITATGDKTIGRQHKVVLVAMALAACFIAGEEMSWGQRALGISTPELLREHNIQKEITIHNLAAVSRFNVRSHKIAGQAILVWCFVSVLLAGARPQRSRGRAGWRGRLRQKLLTIGVPVIPLPLVPFFLLVPTFLLFCRVVKGDEVGEMFLGIAVLVWVVHKYGCPLVSRVRTEYLVMHFLVVTALMATLLATVFPGDFKGRLNRTARRDYPALGLYDQAEQLFIYIYENPIYMQPDTRRQHIEVLKATGYDTVSAAPGRE